MTSIYISFKEKYSFPNLPDGFKLENDMCYTLRKIVKFYQNEERRNEKDIQDELDKYREILNNWANNLPRYERKDD